MQHYAIHIMLHGDITTRHIDRGIMIWHAMTWYGVVSCDMLWYDSPWYADTNMRLCTISLDDWHNTHTRLLWHYGRRRCRLRRRHTRMHMNPQSHFDQLCWDPSVCRSPLCLLDGAWVCTHMHLADRTSVGEDNDIGEKCRSVMAQVLQELSQDNTQR